MNIQTLHLVYFSPTGTTKKTLEAIARGTGVKNILHHDITLPGSVPEKTIEFPANEMVILGAPVYAGRLPDVAVQRLSKFRPAGSPAAVAALYGNREYEDALLEIGELAAATGFVVIAAGAFLGEHSYSTPETPIAAGRPDAEDKRKAEKFGGEVMELFQAISKPEEVTMPELPGNRPFRQKVKHPNAPPETDMEKCTLCGECVEVCPVGAISINGGLATDRELCILCCACVKNCPEQARALTDPRMKQITERVCRLTVRRKEPETFIGGIAA